MKAFIVQMKEPGDLALSTERGLRENILEGGCAWMTARNSWDANEWSRAADQEREPKQYLYAVAYAGPGKQVPYTTLRLENAKTWRTANAAGRAAHKFGGKVMEVVLKEDRQRADGALVPKKVIAVEHAWGTERVYDFGPGPDAAAETESGTGGSREEDPAAGKQETGRGAGTPPRD